MGFKNWETPLKEFELLDAEFHFNVDAAASSDNALCDRYWTEQEDGLAQSWAGLRVFCNPPYDSSLYSWVAKAAEGKARVAVLILPLGGSQHWWHDFIWDASIHAPRPNVQPRYPAYRWHYRDPDHPAKDSPRGDTMVVVFRPVIDFTALSRR